jgi:magnesium transporter
MVFIPLCLSVGGNAGSQASTLVTRALALDQIRVGDWLRVFQRELVMAAALAASLGVLSVGRTYFLTPNSVLAKIPPENFGNLIWVVTLAVMGICLSGALIGALLPLLIKWLRGDPALMSSPFIATLSDVLGIVIYFNIVAVFFF